MAAPLSETRLKLTLVCWAHTWAALRTTFCQAAAEPNLVLKVASRLLDWPAMLVPSGTKLRVIFSGCGQASPDTVGASRVSSTSSRGRSRQAGVEHSARDLP